MFYQLAAEATMVLHVCFGVFVAAGWLAVLRYPRLAWLHAPTVVWGALVNMAGWVCPRLLLVQKHAHLARRRRMPKVIERPHEGTV